MSIAKMKRIALVGLDIEKDKLVDSLQKLGAMELIDQSSKLQEDIWKDTTSFEDNQEEITLLEGRIGRAQIALDIMEKYGQLKAPFFFTRRRISEKEFNSFLEAQDQGEDLLSKVLILQGEINETNDSKNRIEQEMQALTPWLKYDVPLNIKSTKETDICLGILPNDVNMQELAALIDDVAEENYLELISEDDKFIFIALSSIKKKSEEVLSLLKKYGFSKLDFGETEKTPAARIEELQSLLDEADKTHDDLVKQVAELSKVKDQLENYQDIQRVELEKKKAKAKLLNTKKTFIIEGWIPAKAESKLEEILNQSNCYYELRDPKEGEQVPILIRNSRFFTPLESILEMYSLPDYGGVDPTSIFALFYICFFGMMFSDAGYGLILTLGCYIILKKFDLEGNMYKMLKMFMYCGISTIFWGIMFGGFFGDLISAFSKTFLGHEWVLKPLWFNPLDDPMTLLIFSLILGVIHLFVGMGLNAYMEIRDGQIVDAIFNEGSWYVTILGLGMLLGGGTLSVPILSTIGKILTIVGVVMLIIGGARGKKGFAMITGAFSNVYGITSWLSDILSYARLLALGLATGVIAQVVNVMGGLFGGGVAGLVLFILIFIVGTLINFAINVLGSFIHAARLQYVEFFGKFYKDGGDAFKPFARNTKYFRVENEEDIK